MGDSRVRTKNEQEEVHKELGEVRKQMQLLQDKLPREYETHGWVWLFLRNE